MYSLNAPAYVASLALVPATAGLVGALAVRRVPRLLVVTLPLVLLVAAAAIHIVAPWNAGVESWRVAPEAMLATTLGALVGVGAQWRAGHTMLSAAEPRRARALLWLTLAVALMSTLFGVAGYVTVAWLAIARPDALLYWQRVAIAYGAMAFAGGCAMAASVWRIIGTARRERRPDYPSGLP